jgi:hypothetical protein
MSKNVGGVFNGDENEDVTVRTDIVDSSESLSDVKKSDAATRAFAISAEWKFFVSTDERRALKPTTRGDR